MGQFYLNFYSLIKNCKLYQSFIRFSNEIKSYSSLIFRFNLNDLPLPNPALVIETFPPRGPPNSQSLLTEAFKKIEEEKDSRDQNKKKIDQNTTHKGNKKIYFSLHNNSYQQPFKHICAESYQITGFTHPNLRNGKRKDPKKEISTKI